MSFKINNTDEYCILKNLSKNVTCEIYLIKQHNSNVKMILKKTDLEQLVSNNFERIQAELQFVKLVQHPNILKYYNSFINDHYLWTFMPYLSYGTITDVIANYYSNGLPEIIIIKVLYDLLKAITYLHSRNLIHRNICSDNVLLSSRGDALLTGLRYTKSMYVGNKKMSRLHDFPYYAKELPISASPEMLAQDLRGYNQKSDIYSLGLVTCHMASGSIPFSNMERSQTLLEKINGNLPKYMCYFPQRPSFLVPMQTVRERFSGILNNNQAGPSSPPVNSVVSGEKQNLDVVSGNDRKIADESNVIRREVTPYTDAVLKKTGITFMSQDDSVLPDEEDLLPKENENGQPSSNLNIPEENVNKESAPAVLVEPCHKMKLLHESQLLIGKKHQQQQQHRHSIVCTYANKKSYGASKAPRLSVGANLALPQNQVPAKTVPVAKKPRRRFKFHVTKVVNGEENSLTSSVPTYPYKQQPRVSLFKSLKLGGGGDGGFLWPMRRASQGKKSRRKSTVSYLEVSYNLQNLIFLCLRYEPDERPTAENLMLHALFKKVYKFRTEHLASSMTSLNCKGDILNNSETSSDLYGPQNSWNF